MKTHFQVPYQSRYSCHSHSYSSCTVTCATPSCWWPPSYLQPSISLIHSLCNSPSCSLSKCSNHLNINNMLNSCCIALLLNHLHIHCLHTRPILSYIFSLLYSPPPTFPNHRHTCSTTQFVVNAHNWLVLGCKTYPNLIHFKFHITTYISIVQYNLPKDTPSLINNIKLRNKERILSKNRSL